MCSTHSMLDSHAAATQVPVFVVLGANGRTGVECVKEILRRSHDETDPMYNCKVSA